MPCSPRLHGHTRFDIQRPHRIVRRASNTISFDITDISGNFSAQTMATLQDPIRIGDWELPNRVIMA
ncbi:MAG TPA: hypothetical protein VK673_18770, partial [Chthoniobacterales bacterium]|nr:hypothetical protein [Chthoniobacterales bacterium]